MMGMDTVDDRSISVLALVVPAYCTDLHCFT